MKVLVLGATGMIGEDVLREGLLDPAVTSVVTLCRSATAQAHAKLANEAHSAVPKAAAKPILDVRHGKQLPILRAAIGSVQPM